MKQTIQIGKHTIRADFGFIAVLLLLFATSCFALYNSFNFISVGSGKNYLIRQTLFYTPGIHSAVCHEQSAEQGDLQLDRASL